MILKVLLLKTACIYCVHTHTHTHTHTRRHVDESEALKMRPRSRFRLSRIFLQVFGEYSSRFKIVKVELQNCGILMSNGQDVNRKDQMDSHSERGLKEGQLWKTAATELLRRLNLTGSPCNAWTIERCRKQGVL